MVNCYVYIDNKKLWVARFETFTLATKWLKRQVIPAFIANH